MDHGTRRLLGVKIADTGNTADIAPLAQEAKEPAGKMPEAAPRDGGANLNLAVSIAHAEEGASGKREARQACAHLAGNPTSLRQERTSRTLGERLRIPGSIEGARTAGRWPASSRSTTASGGTLGWAATPPQRRRASS